MGTSPIDLAKVRARKEVEASVKALMSAVASLAGEIKRLERIMSYGK